MSSNLIVQSEIHNLWIYNTEVNIVSYKKINCLSFSCIRNYADLLVIIFVQLNFNIKEITYY